MSEDLTIGDLARHFNQPMWRVRRAVDALPVPIRRLGLYRVIPITLLPLVREELERRGWLTEQEVAAR